jgi:hypothetical protein
VSCLTVCNYQSRAIMLSHDSKHGIEAAARGQSFAMMP